MFPGLAYGGVYKLLNGKEPFDLRNSKKDSEMTQKAEKYRVSSIIILRLSTTQNMTEN